MVGQSRISDVNALLRATRRQIELLRVAVEQHPRDRELRKFLKEATNEEAVILAKLTEWSSN